MAGHALKLQARDDLDGNEARSVLIDLRRTGTAEDSVARRSKGTAATNSCSAPCR